VVKPSLELLSERVHPEDRSRFKEIVARVTARLTRRHRERPTSMNVSGSEE
jgi:hypothetical protein